MLTSGHCTIVKPIRMMNEKLSALFSIHARNNITGRHAAPNQDGTSTMFLVEATVTHSSISLTIFFLKNVDDWLPNVQT